MSRFTQSIIAIATLSAAMVVAENQLLVNENGIALKRDAAGNVGWWSSNEEPVVFSAAPVFGQESELKTTDGLCITIDDSDDNSWPVLGACTGELYLFENNLIRWYKHAEICFSEVEGMLSTDSACDYRAHYVAQPVVNEQEISCEHKYLGRSDHPSCSSFQELKLCCKYSHNCGSLHKCTSSFCCKSDSRARYLDHEPVAPVYEQITHTRPVVSTSAIPEVEITLAPAETTTEAPVVEYTVDEVDVVVDEVVDVNAPEPTTSPSLQEPRSCANLSTFTRLVHCTDGAYDESLADVIASRYSYKEMCCTITLTLN